MTEITEILLEFLFLEMNWYVFLYCGSVGENKGLWLQRLLPFSFSFIFDLFSSRPFNWIQELKKYFSKKACWYDYLSIHKQKVTFKQDACVQNFHNQGTITKKIFSALVCILILPWGYCKIFIFFFY